MSYALKECDEPVSSRLKYKGVFDYNGLGTFIIKWLMDRHFEFDEGTHKHKMSCPHGFKIERTIKAWRRIDDMLKYHIIIDITLLDAFEVDAVKDGKNVKLWDARMDLKIGFKVEFDYAERYGTSPFMEKLRRFYCEYIVKKEMIAEHGDPLYYKSLALHEGVKEFLKMDTSHHFVW